MKISSLKLYRRKYKQKHPALTVQGIFVGNAANNPFALYLFVLIFHLIHALWDEKKADAFAPAFSYITLILTW